jgi:hypothetical protein
VKILFLPISIIGGLLSGQLAKKLFDLVWARIDDEDAPRPKHREIGLPYEPVPAGSDVSAAEPLRPAAERLGSLAQRLPGRRPP